MKESAINIRPETLRPASKWEQADKDEVREILRLAGLTGGEAAKLLGLTPHTKKSGAGSRTVRRWTGGDSDIPYPAWALLAYQAGFGIIWVE